MLLLILVLLIILILFKSEYNKKLEKMILLQGK